MGVGGRQESKKFHEREYENQSYTKKGPLVGREVRGALELGKGSYHVLRI